MFRGKRTQNDFGAEIEAIVHLNVDPCRTHSAANPKFQDALARAGHRR